MYQRYKESQSKLGNRYIKLTPYNVNSKKLLDRKGKDGTWIPKVMNQLTKKGCLKLRLISN